MDNENALTPLSTNNLDLDTQKIAQEILDSKDLEKVKDLTALFELNAKKKNVVRMLKMSQLLDNATDKVLERFEKTPDNFSNDDLIKFMQVSENSLDKASKRVSGIEESQDVKLQQNNQVNINITQDLSRDSRARVTEAVNSILKKLTTTEELRLEDEDVQNEE